MGRYTERRSHNFRRSQDESQSDGKIIVWSNMFLCPRRLKVNKEEKYNHSRPLNYQNIKKIIIKFTCTNPTHLASYSVGVLLSLQAQDFLTRPQVQCTASRAACMHTCFQRCFEFQPSIIAADSSAPFLLRVCFCLLIRDEVGNVRGRTV